MIDQTAAQRYAEAYVNSLEKAGVVDVGLDELDQMATIYADEDALRAFLTSPEIAPNQKEALLRKLWADSVSQAAMSLMLLLVKWERVDHLPEIAISARRIAEDRQGKLRAQVTTARSMEDAETQALAQTLGKALNKTIIVESDVDPDLIGGVRIQIGTKVLDGSVQAQLKQVQQDLEAVKVT